MLKLDEITHSFGETAVLEDVSVVAEAGRARAIVGPNAAGKTTLMRIAGGLLEPKSGRVSLEGESVAEMSRRAVARRVSMLRQAAPQVFGYTALELVLMGFHAESGRFSLPSEGQRERALEALATLDIEGLAGRPATALSGGELQRVLMARTMVADTPIWLLDEPTSHLDMRHRVALLDQMRGHLDEGGAVLAVLHDLALVSRFFDDVLVLKEGAVVAEGPVDEALEEQLLSEVFGVPIRRGEVDGQVVWVPVG
jgi:iron complex transport system ATP-binding protein